MDICEAIPAKLLSVGLTLFAPVPLASCTVTKNYLLERAGIGNGTVFVCAVPYLTPECAGEHNISAYCSVRDYHRYFDVLWEIVCGGLSREFPQNRFAGFADRSPIDERDAAARAGLGVIGKNGMLITERYSSYVFLGELITDAAVSCDPREPVYCENCGACTRACPAESLGQCLSALTQKKGVLTREEADAMIKYSTAWGCDICQRVCPHTVRAAASGTLYTDIDYFLTDVIPDLDSTILSAMSDGEFEERAFSWRGRETVRRNLSVLENNDKKRNV